MSKYRASLLLAAVCALAAAVPPAAGDFPEYVNQNSAETNRHSGICTSDGKVIWDSTFATIVGGPFPVWPPPQPVYEEMAFAFMECYGGGMFDELLAIGGGGLDPASFTSAARENEQSWWANTDPASGGKRESLYNLHYSPYAGGATIRRHDQAGQNGYNNDLYGPVVANPLKEHPQYVFTHLLMDRTDVTLHQPNINGQTPDEYLAILFGGSVDDNDSWRERMANYNSLVRIHADLVARGYTSDEIYLMYPSASDPNGNALPASWVVDDGTAWQDMFDAWTWVQNQADANTQIYFWSNICHGDETEDVVGMVLDNYGTALASGVPYGFDLTGGFVQRIQELHAFYGGGDGTGDGQPYFQVIASRLLGDLTVILNGQALAPLGVSDQDVWGQLQYEHRFALDAADVADLGATGNVFEFLWSGADPVEFSLAGVVSGGRANGLPEPACVAMLAIGAAALLRRRSSRSSQRRER